MIGKALNENNDIFIEAGRFKMVEDAAETVQHVRTRLQFYLGEWFLDLTAGTPYFQDIFKKPAELANVESIIKQRILQTEGVSLLTEFAMVYDESTRVITITVSAETIYGSIDSEEVTING